MEIYWHDESAEVEAAKLDAWLHANDCKDIAVIAIAPTVVIAFGNESLGGRGSNEIRAHHPDLSSALTAVLARLRRVP
ncbi:MAG: hypothetical protein QOE00_462 [Ilumatobacteraceae bacterium]|jgi:hypothetical protein